jgi:hypothetical protein
MTTLVLAFVLAQPLRDGGEAAGAQEFDTCQHRR